LALLNLVIRTHSGSPEGLGSARTPHDASGPVMWHDQVQPFFFGDIPTWFCWSAAGFSKPHSPVCLFSRRLAAFLLVWSSVTLINKMQHSSWLWQPSNVRP